jgi:hypothetical protein
MFFEELTVRDPDDVAAAVHSVQLCWISRFIDAELQRQTICCKKIKPSPLSLCVKNRVSNFLYSL